MVLTSLQKLIVMEHKSSPDSNKWFRCCQSAMFRPLMLVVLAAFLLLSSFVIPQNNSVAHAADAQTSSTCSWYTITRGDTLYTIARRYQVPLWTLASINGIRNVNMIFAGQRLCIRYTANYVSSGLLSNGNVRWYAYDALEASTPGQVTALLRQEAAHYQLPAGLLLAIAWQESGWNQHVIARDGGIGAMQIMPYTAAGLNTAAGTHYDPYKLSDNIALGAIYLHFLMVGFHGDLVRVISAYNEGGWNVIHRGIFNWRYVYNVQTLMRKFG